MSLFLSSAIFIRSPYVIIEQLHISSLKLRNSSFQRYHYFGVSLELITPMNDNTAATTENEVSSIFSYYVFDLQSVVGSRVIYYPLMMFMGETWFTLF